MYKIPNELVLIFFIIFGMPVSAADKLINSHSLAVYSSDDTQGNRVVQVTAMTQ